jgi:hypothetical protein
MLLAAARRQWQLAKHYVANGTTGQVKSAAVQAGLSREGSHLAGLMKIEEADPAEPRMTAAKRQPAKNYVAK